MKFNKINFYIIQNVLTLVCILILYQTYYVSIDTIHVLVPYFLDYMPCMLPYALIYSDVFYLQWIQNYTPLYIIVYRKDSLYINLNLKSFHQILQFLTFVSLKYNILCYIFSFVLFETHCMLYVVLLFCHCLFHDILLFYLCL